MRAPSCVFFAVSATAAIFAACGDDALPALRPETDVLEVFQPDGTSAEVIDTSRPDTTPDTVPVDTVPVDTTPADTTPADTSRPDTTPADTVPADTTPADTTPADTVPADTTPADTTPADTTPADTVPADTTPADTAPADTGPQACPAPADEKVVTRSTIYRQENFSGAKNQVKFETDLCSDTPDSVERTYRFDLPQAMEIYAATDCGWDCELVLTRDGCTDADVMTCETTLGDEAFGQTYNAGTYRLFIEGDNPGDVAPYDLMLNLHNTGGQANCQAQALDVINTNNCQDPTFGAPRYELAVTGQTQASDIDDFFVQDVGGCTHDGDHIGGAPDRVYSFTLPGPREVDITLAPNGWDALLYVTGSPCGAKAQVKACSDDVIGSKENVNLTLPAGTWYIVVDGFGEETFSDGASGPFDLTVLVYDDICIE